MSSRGFRLQREGRQDMRDRGQRRHRPRQNAPMPEGDTEEEWMYGQEGRTDNAVQWAEENEDKTRPDLRKTHKLMVPVKMAGQWVETVVFRYPTCKDLKLVARANADDIETTEIMFLRLTQLTQGAIDQLHVIDVADMGEIVAGFHERRSLPKPE